MSQTLNLHAGEHQIPFLDNYHHIICNTFDTDYLRRLHNTVSVELGWRSSDITTYANPDLAKATVSELRQILQEILGQVRTILSIVRTTLRETGYAD